MTVKGQEAADHTLRCKLVKTKETYKTAKDRTTFEKQIRYYNKVKHKY